MTRSVCASANSSVILSSTVCHDNTHDRRVGWSTNILVTRSIYDQPPSYTPVKNSKHRVEPGIGSYNSDMLISIILYLLQWKLLEERVTGVWTRMGKWCGGQSELVPYRLGVSLTLPVSIETFTLTSYSIHKTFLLKTDWYQVFCEQDIPAYYLPTRTWCSSLYSELWDFPEFLSSVLLLSEL